MCDTCRLREHFEQLWEVNAEAWQLYGSLNSQPVVDYQLGPMLFQSFCGDRSPDEVVGLIDRISLIASVLRPPDAKS